MEQIKITRLQRQWLDSRGGRNEWDLERDEEGLYCWFGNGEGGEMKIYLPNI